MKNITNTFKNNVKTMGRQIESKITYTKDDEVIELGMEELNSVTPHYESSILKSTMKQLDIDSNEDIPIGTEVNYQFGIKTHEPYNEPYDIKGNTEQNVISAEEGTTLTQKSFNLTDVDTFKENTLLLYGDTSQSGTPTPSSPVPVNNVTGRQEIDVAGKNLLDNSKIVKGRLDNGVVGYKSNTTDFSYTNNSITFTTDAAWRGVTSDYIKIKPNTNYTYSAVENLGSSTYQIDIHEYDNNKQWIKSVALVKTNNIAKFTSDSNGKYIIIGFLNPVSGTYTINNPMFEEGNQSSTFEPYIGKQYEINLGKNLVDITTLQTGYVQSNGAINTTPNPNQGEMYSPFINVKPNTTYTFSIIKTTSTYDNWIGIGEYSSSSYSSFVTRQSIQHQSYFTFTTGNNTQYVILSSRNLALATEIQFEIGTATSYSSYKTPIELCKIGDYQDYIRKSTGKNLFDKNNLEICAYNLGTTGVIPSKITSTTRIALSPQNAIAVSPETTYTISAPSTTYITIGELANDRTLIQQNGWQATNYTFTTGATTHYIMFNGYYNNGVTITVEIFNILKNAIQVEEGSQATTYEPYGKVWYLHKEIGKIVLNGSETWNYSSGNVVFYADVLSKPMNSYFYTTHFNYVSGNTFSQWQNGNCGSDSGVRLIVKNTNYTNKNDFKNWLSTNNVIVYYILNNSTNTEITDTELIEQLDELYTAELYFGITNINTNASNLETYIKLHYNFVTPAPSPERQSLVVNKTGHITEIINNEEYEFDLGDIELCKIGDYQDKIYKNNNKWYLHKEINKNIFAGSNNDTYNFNSDNTNTIALNINPNGVSNNFIKVENVYSLYCDKFIYEHSVNDTEHVYITGAYNVGNNFRLYINKSRLTGYSSSMTNEQKIELVKTWLNSNPITVYSIAVTSTIEEITNTELINQLEAVGKPFEFLSFGNYIVYNSEKKEDTGSYNITCYDKMLYSMKPYEKMNITYPISIRDYIQTICNKIGLTFGSSSANFTNYEKQIQNELYLSYNEEQHDYTEDMGYTFRDVLDELAQATASTICINDNDELEVRYITTTNDIIDGQFLKNVNVNFGQKYGPVNSIVLSRSGDADKIYEKDDESIEENGLCEINISENQIMNFNDRDTYLHGIFTKLNGLEYYLNDFSSTGITYYDVCDRYSVQIDDKIYSCVMFNDDIMITQGLEENIHTDMPEESETDYEKADKTDRKINQTYLIVDKQNQTIQSVINTTTEQNNKISQITQTVDDLNSKIQDIADITVSGESEFATFTLDNINESEPIMIKVRPTSSSGNISYLYPRSNLYPSSTLYSTNRKIRFVNTRKYEITTDKIYNNYREYFSYDGTNYLLLEKGSDYQVGNTITGTIYQNETIDYEIPDDLLYYDSTHFDEFYLDYDSQTCQITKRCKYNADGTISLLAQEETISYPYPTINLTDGDYILSLLGYNYGYIFVRLMASNIYTSQFATKVEVSSQINQTAEEINLEVARKTNKDEIISTINQTAEQIKINANKVSLAGKTIELTSDNIAINSTNFKVDKDGNMIANNGTFSGNISGSTLNGATINGAKIDINTSNIAEGFIVHSDNNAATFEIKSMMAQATYNGQQTIALAFGTGSVICQNLSCFGSKQRIVPIDDGTIVGMNAYETTTPYFGDIGSNKTNENGECKIEIENIFSQTIEKENYKVFIQECGDGHLYVEKFKNYFIVKGTPNIEFDWEIKAIQKGYANIRLQEFNKERND